MTRQRQSIELPSECNLRRAVATDAKQIKQMVHSEPLVPIGLYWSQFWVIERKGHLLACGQLRCYRGIQELGSLVVASSWRNQKLGTYLAQHLVEQASTPLYLSCAFRLKQFYERLGFREIYWLNLPYPIKLKFGFAKLLALLMRKHLILMQYF